MNTTATLCNAEITLRAPEPEDLDVMYRIENDTQLWDFGNSTVPYSRYALRQYIESGTQDIFSDKQARFMIELNQEAAVAGIIDLCAFDPLNNRAEIGIVILSEYRGRHIARQAVQLLCKYSHIRLHLHQLYAYTPADHAESRALFGACGFTESALLPQWLHSDKGYGDALLLQNIFE